MRFVWRVCTLWLNLARDCFMLVRPFAILTRCDFVLNTQHYWTKWSAVKSKWVKVIRKLPCRYGKEFAEGWGRWSFVPNAALFRFRYLRRVCMKGPLLNNRISDSLKTLVIITYSMKSSGLHLCQSVKMIQRFRNLLCPPFHGAPWRRGSLSVKCRNILTPDATICPRRFNWIL